MHFSNLAKSHTQPRSLAGYQQHLSRSNGLSGMLEMKIVGPKQAFLGCEWKKKYLILKQGVLYYFSVDDDKQTEESFDNVNLKDAQGSVSLEDVNKVQQKAYGGSTSSGAVICLKTYEVAYFLQAEAKKEFEEWLFTFHKAVIEQLLNKLATAPQEHLGLNGLDLRLNLASSKTRSHRKMSTSGVYYYSRYSSSDESTSGSLSPRETTMGRECRSNNFMHGVDINGTGAAQSELEGWNSREHIKSIKGFPAPLPRLPTVDMGHGAPSNMDHMSLRALALSPRSPDQPRHWDSVYPPEPISTSKSTRKSDIETRMPSVDEEDSAAIEKGDISSDSNGCNNKLRSSFDWGDAKSPGSGNESLEESSIPVVTKGEDTIGASHQSSGRYVPPHLRQESEANADIPTSYSIDNEPLTPPLRGSSLSVSDDDIFGMDGAINLHDNIREIGVCADQGHRRQMEDFDVTVSRLVNPNSVDEFSDELDIAFHAVYDGHGGIDVAQMAAERIHVYAARNATMFVDTEGAKQAVTDAFIQLESEILEIARTDARLTAGCCALVALLKTNKNTSKRTLAIANLGDSRAVLCRGGKAMDLTKGHCPGRNDEKKRIEQAGGWVTSEREMVVERIHHIDVGDEQIFNRAKKKLDYVEIFRVNGELAVSRALGDVEYKLPRINEYPYWLFPPGHPGNRRENDSSLEANDFAFNANLVIAEPEWTDIDLGDEDEFLILACDGLWEVMDSSEAVQTVIQAGLDAQTGSENLVNTALRLGSTDNVTAIVVNLNRKTK